MKTIPAIFLGGALFAALATGAQAADEPEARAATTSVAAEVWAFDNSKGVAPKVVFEQWRASVPPAQAGSVALDGLSLPGRGGPAMTRVAGFLVPPVSGDYAFFVHGPGGQRGARSGGETELWIEDAESGAWILAQRTGDPNRRSGRTRLEKGVPRRFELWHMGSTAVSIDWEIRDWDPVAGAPIITLARETVPAAAMRPRDPDRDGSRDVLGPEGPWGDPDGDGLLNWQERLAGTDPLKADTEGREGLVRWELWRNIPGRYVFDLKRAADYPAGPREVRHLDRLEIPTGNGDNYGSRLRGFIRPPADGDYTFKIIADGTAELWLGENESWQSKRLVAQADQPPGAARLRWTRNDEEGRVQPLRAEQIARVRLLAGREYYIEVLHKQDGGQDHCAVAWVLPGTEEPALIGARHLVSWRPCPTDAADDGLPDEWQRAAGLLDAQVDPSMRHAEADPDGDGATNREEWLAGTDPLRADDAPDSGRMLLSEAWTDIPGRSVSSLTGHPRFPADPDVTTRIDNLDFGQEGNHYGVRLRGYLTAPEDGAYRFSISGNNACILYLAESEDKFTKRVVARVEVGTHWRSFTVGGHPRSGPVPLKRGQRYYIEVIFKRDEDENDKTDHSSVGWKRPGEDRFSVIRPEFFSLYKPDPRDLDDDDLPDDWERLHGLDPADPSGDNGAWGDPDGDGLENFREFQLGLDPRTPDVHGTPGLALWEAWDNIEDLIPAHRDGDGLAQALWGDLRFPLHPPGREWRDALDAPRRQGKHFGARMRAHVIAPVTGDYVFSIAGRDVGELYLSPDDSKFNRRRVASFRHGTSFRSWDLRPGQMSAPVRLEAGEIYYIEAIYARGGFNHTDDFFSIGWKLPGADSFTLINSKHLVAFFRDPNDFDDDDLPDDWEIRYGLDPTDPRGDHGPHGDPDGDGLTNIEEYRLGTDPRNRDTDGDGISDYDEAVLMGTNPLVEDVAPFQPVGTIGGREASHSTGAWRADGDGLVNTGLRGAVDYQFEVPHDGVYLIEFRATNWHNPKAPPGAELVFFVDSTPIARREMQRMGGQPEVGTYKILTPWLRSGSHTLQVFLHNAYRHRKVVFEGFSVLSAAGLDRNGDSIPDWVTTQVTGRNSLDPAMTESKVSPACLEGRGKWISFAGGADFFAAPDGRWFANVELRADGEPTELDLNFENGGHRERTAISWTVTNLIEEPVHTVRQGDSLLLTALTVAGADDRNAELVTLSVEGKTLAFSPWDPQPYRFDTPGRIALEATVTSRTTTRKVQAVVNVVPSPEAESPAYVPGHRRGWNIGGVGEAVITEWDESVTHYSEFRLDDESDTTRHEFKADAPFDLFTLFRLGEGGPVLGSVPLRRVTLQSGDATGATVVSEFDGVSLIEMPVVLTPVLEGLTARISIFVGGVTFGDGSGPNLELTAADFSEQGETIVDFLKPNEIRTSVCHRSSLWQGAERIAQFD